MVLKIGGRSGDCFLVRILYFCSYRCKEHYISLLHGIKLKPKTIGELEKVCVLESFVTLVGLLLSYCMGGLDDKGVA